MIKIGATTITQNLTARTEFKIPGRYFRLMDTAAAVKIELFSLGVVVGVLDGFLAGLAADAVEFDAVAVTPATPGVVSFVIADAPIRYDRSAGSVTVMNLPPPQGIYINSRAAVSVAAVVLAANAARRYCLIQNNDAVNAIRITHDGSVPTAAAGIRIAAGGYWESPAGFAPTGAITAIAEAGSVAVELVEG